MKKILTVNLFIAILSLLPVFGCGNKKFCNDFAYIDLGKFIVDNNTWGKRDITEYERCIFLDNNAGRRRYGWNWTWPFDMLLFTADGK